MPVIKAKKKPVVIEAIQWNGNSNKADIDNFVGKELAIQLKSETIYAAHQGPPYFDLFIETLEGVMKVSPGDYIIKGVDGEFYPCKPNIFHKTYDIID